MLTVNYSNPLFKENSHSIIFKLAIISSFILIFNFCFKKERFSLPNQLTQRNLEFLNYKFILQGIYSKFVMERVQSMTYKGTWNSTNINSRFMHFESNFGELVLTFDKDQVFFSLNDGNYNDNRIKFSFWINLKNQEFEVVQENQFKLRYVSNIVLTQFEYISEMKKENCENQFIFEFMNLISNQFFEEINGIVSSKCNLNFIYSTKIILNQKEYPDPWKIREFLLILIILAVLQIVHSFQILKKLSSNLNLANNYSLSFVCSNMIWNSFMSTACFLGSLHFEEYINTFCLVGLLYFVNFSIFEIKILLLLWKIKYIQRLNDLYFLRRKLLQFYGVLYVLLLVFLCLSYYIFLHSYLLFFVILFTFIPQIIKNCQTGNNPLFLYNYLIISSNKMFLPLYIRMCPKNILGVKPDYFFSISSILIVSFQLCLLLIQKICGTTSIIPKFLRKKTYNYFRDLKEIKCENNNIEDLTCCICLQQLNQKNDDINYFEDTLIKKKRCKIFSYLSNLCIKNDKKPFMLTPCNHLFHTECLKPWHLHKEECPMCRLVLPKIFV